MPEWLVVILVVIVAAFIARVFLGTVGLQTRLDQIKDRTGNAADAIMVAFREESGAVRSDIEQLRQKIEVIRSQVDELWANRFEPWREGLEREGYGAEEIEAVRALHQMMNESHPLAPVVTTWQKMYPDVAKKYFEGK